MTQRSNSPCSKRVLISSVLNGSANINFLSRVSNHLSYLCICSTRTLEAPRSGHQLSTIQQKTLHFVEHRKRRVEENSSHYFSQHCYIVV
jgi:hypothetical protein